MSQALIGFSGFVGSNLLRQGAYGFHYNSGNIADIGGRSFDRVVCAGVSAVKWWANQNPEEDRAGIERLMAQLRHVAADMFVLISTVDVYATPLGVTEDDAAAFEGLHAYGTNRLMLERFVAERFDRHLIVRLPALFGDGLKKNALYDLMHDNRTDLINPDGQFQWYPLQRLGRDLARIEGSDVQLMNLATQPVSMATIRDRFFPHRQLAATDAPGGRYDMRTRYAALLDGADGYVLDAAAVLASMAKFLASHA